MDDDPSAGSPGDNLGGSSGGPGNSPGGQGSNLGTSPGGSPGGGNPGSSSGPSGNPSDPDRLPWAFALALLSDGDLVSLPSVHTVLDIPESAQRSCGKAVGLLLSRLAADTSDKAAHTVLFLFARWVLRRDH
jgi:hypothetical protein